MTKFVPMQVYPTTRHNAKILAAMLNIYMADLIDNLVEDAMLTHQDKLLPTLLDGEPEYKGEGIS